MKITEEFIEKIASPRGGWNRPQLALLGVDWPPTTGWKRRLIGMEISEETARRLEELSETTRMQRRAIEAGQEDLFG
jgi:hypothetical protein